MRSTRKFLCWATTVITLGSASPLFAQTFAANTGTEPVIRTVPPRTTQITVPHPHNAEDNQIFGRVRDGVYTVDGMVAKVKLNYDIDGVRYMYLFVPGLGTAVLSLVADPNAAKVEARMHENDLTFAVEEHQFKLSGVALADNKGKVPAHLYVKLDRSAWQLQRQPMVGFGDVGAMPYIWPGALPPQNAAKVEQSTMAPPVPAVLLPSTRTVRPAAAAPSPVSMQPAALGGAALN